MLLPELGPPPFDALHVQLGHPESLGAGER